MVHLPLAVLAGASLLSTASAHTPIVHSQAGIFHGRHLPSFNQDVYLGIKYAPQPERFAPAALSADAPATHFNASRYGVECQAYGGDTNKLVAMPGGQTRLGEDCLHLNIVRPGTNATGLPVLLWIYGGGWLQGSTSDPRYDRPDQIETSRV